MKQIALFFLAASALWSCQSSEEKSESLKEPYRPAIHFSPETGWTNDPNGLVYYAGEYHLFFQHYPDSTVWGPMHWGHAVSTDLVHWEELPIALYPDSLGWIFSGSAVMDLENTSGLGSKENPAMVAIYTYHNSPKEQTGANDFQYQGLAYSLDKGRSWEKYTENPVLPNPGIRDFRDPKVSWFEEFQKWIMILAVQDHVEIYSSTNLTAWQKESEFGKTQGAHGGVWECPDLMAFDLEGQKKYVMLVSVNPGGPNGGSATQYFVGDFDGHAFDPNSNETRWVDYGKDNYAGVTFSNSPDQRKVFIGWLNNWQYANQIPTGQWRGAMTIPRELTLRKDGENFELYNYPVSEFESLQGETSALQAESIREEKILTSTLTPPAEIKLRLGFADETSPLFEIVLSNDLGEKVVLHFDGEQLVLDNTQNGWDDPNHQFAVKSTAPFSIENGTLSLDLVLDRASMEVFADAGKRVLTSQYFPTKPYTQLSIKGNVDLEEGEIKTLK
ncbi:glycoside hydrolase family 32 protein [Marinilongibacter aquaticus]|uniref:glycoside hydrolase family 32 protein n=1 Tax=Marinilongibacter aquaticus TaxID=2975157 RepID=UPI0021BDE7D2|nr:glycoside hydrolase family 32 protein [Marinilongibacter aquaticus]UBM59090.1 glycoside hydrolase family 32 protein [Marinilongibacter aquaticus]